MSAILSSTVPRVSSSRAKARTGPTTLRAALVVACAVALAGTLAAVDAAPLLLADPGLARLLRGMALVKALLLAGALVVLWWRFGHPIVGRVAAGYVAGAASMAVATALIWQLAALLPAAALFHAGLFAVLGLAWRGDDMAPVRPRPVGGP